jgi:hypothetical protein
MRAVRDAWHKAGSDARTSRVAARFPPAIRWTLFDDFAGLVVAQGSHAERPF